jgi:branched-chain amino acid transport system permease protein
LSALPFGVSAPWVLNLFVFTLMYAALASAWNLVGGYSGYISLGHAAFFGVGAYAIGILFTHVSIGGGYRPFYVLPLVGLGVAVGSLPIGWVLSHILLRVIYYLVLTPVALVFRLAGRDPLALRRRDATSHWVPFAQGEDGESYFRQT